MRSGLLTREKKRKKRRSVKATIQCKD